MAKTPADIDLRQHKETARYYDGNRYPDDEAVDKALDRGAIAATWWVCLFGVYELDEAEEDVVAPNKSEASAVMRAALARDFDPGCKLGKIFMA